jgi:hypothetical protein
MPQPNFVPAAVLASINNQTRIDWKDNGSGEWFYLESPTLPDAALFAALRQNWHRIAGPHAMSLALIYCEQEPDSGIWLHYLPTFQHKVEFLCGCHQIPSWS